MGLPRPRDCKVCGVTYRKNNDNYCSRKCYNVGRLKPRIEGDCEQCGKHYVSKYTTTNTAYRTRITRRYCSTECRVKAQTKGRVESPCEVCGTIRMIYPSDIKLGRGRFCSKRCQGTTIAGPNHPLWNNGSTIEREQARKSVRYKEWRTAVFIRDGKTCVLCGYKGPDIEADHIKSWARYPDLRYEVTNGRTLCHDCHTKTPSYMNRWYAEN